MEDFVLSVELCCALWNVILCTFSVRAIPYQTSCLLLRRLSLGTEMVYQKAEGIQGAMLSLGGSYTAPKWEAAARVGLHAWQATYLHKLDSSLTVVADMEGSMMQVRGLFFFFVFFRVADNYIHFNLV